MRYRKMGRTGLKVSAFCLGTMTFGRQLEEEASIRIIHAALDVVTSPRTTVPIERAIPGARGETWEDLAHVVAGKEQKIRFCRTLFDWLQSN